MVEKKAKKIGKEQKQSSTNLLRNKEE